MPEGMSGMLLLLRYSCVRLNSEHTDSGKAVNLFSPRRRTCRHLQVCTKRVHMMGVLTLRHCSCLAARPGLWGLNRLNTYEHSASSFGRATS